MAASGSGVGGSSASANTNLNVILAIQEYFERAVAQVSGMKVLLLDGETIKIIGLALTQSDILKLEVFLATRLDSNVREEMQHMKCVCFLRPTQANVDALKVELKNPKYGEYYLFFTNFVDESLLRQLAEADVREVIMQVNEYYADFLAVNRDLFTFDLPEADGHSLQRWDGGQHARVKQGLLAVLLALKKKPIIRYSAKSGKALTLGDGLKAKINEYAPLFEAKRNELAPLLLILDRRDDPVTPLLVQWTYQAMIHEFFGIQYNKVNMRDVPDAPKDMTDVIVSCEQDKFFNAAMYKNLGDLADYIKEVVDQYKGHQQENQNISSFSDMKKFLERFPKFRELAGAVTKHITMSSEISRQVNERHLMDVSEVEQEIAVNNSMSAHFQAVSDLLNNPAASAEDKLGAVLVYALRYERSANNNLAALIEECAGRGFTQDQLALISSITIYGGAEARVGDLFGNATLFKNIASFNPLRVMQNVQCVYTRHQPLLKNILDSLAQRKLSLQDYPYLQGHDFPKDARHQEVIVFIVGGCNFTEAAVVAEFNANNPGMKVILGGTEILNRKAFLEQVRDQVNE